MILLEKKVKKGMIEEALKALPAGCCGFVFGIESENGDRVFSEFLPVENVTTDSNTTYEITPEDYIKAEVFAHEVELNLLGIYHSHPTGNSEPTIIDKERALPHFSYIILSMPEQQKIEIRSWQLNDAMEFEEELIYKTEKVQQ
jgi:proteasome lid subunit RPN8/RPN11